MIKIIFSSGAFAALLFPALARAEASSASEDKSDILVLGTRPTDIDETIRTGSRLGLTIFETPASVETLSGDTIRTRGDLSIVDAVTRATGISSVANPGNGGTGLAARGFSDQGSVMILYDGVRLYPGAGTVTFPTDPWTIDRIEILRGAASVLYGQGAIGGAVNVMSKKPRQDRTAFDFEAGYGSQNSWRVGAGVGGPVTDILSYRIDASRTGSDGWVTRGVSKGLAVSGSLRLTPTDNFSLTLSDDYSDQHPMRYFGTPLINGELDKRNRRLNYNVLDAVMHFEDNRTTLKAEWGSAESIRLVSTAYRLTARRRWRNLESYFHDGATATVDRADYLGIDHAHSQVGDQTSLTARRTIAGMKNEFVVGFDVNHIKFRHSNNFYPGAADIPGSSVDPFLFAPGLFDTTAAIRPAYRTRTVQYSVFAEDRLTLNDQISLIVGINREHANVKRYTISEKSAQTQVLDKSLSNTSWRVGAVYQPRPALSLYAQYATAVDPLGSLVTLSPGDAQFKNTTGDQVEGGFKAGFWHGRATFTFAAYRIVKKNLLVRDPADLTSTTVLQVGRRSSKGLEGSLALELPEGVGLDANASVLEARFDSFNAGGVLYNGRTPPGVPEATANLFLRYAVTAPLQARLGLRYVGKTYSDNANRFRVPAYTVVDGGISFAVTTNVAANLRVYNLFDRVYATTTYNDEQWLLGRLRSIDVSISARF